MAINKQNMQTDATRRVTFLNDPTINEDTGLYYVLAQDNKGFQFQVALDALPPGTASDHLNQNNQWFVENKAGIWRPTVWCGTTQGLPVNDPTVTGYYGSFYDTTTQTVGGTNAATIVTLNTFDSANGILLTSGSNSCMTFQNAGVYNIQFSAQVYNPVNGTSTTNFWLRQNGTDIPWSSGEVDTTNQQHYTVPSWNSIVTVASGDNIQLVWSSTASTMQLVSVNPATVGPSSPSIILTAQQISNTLSAGSIITGGSTNTVNNLQGQNVIANGALEFWQRGTSFTGATNFQYTADRWCGWGGFATASSPFTISRQTSSLNGFQYCSRIQRNSGQTSTSQPYFGQSLETVTSLPLANQTVTLSFYARAGANFSATGSLLYVQIPWSTGTDNNVATAYSPIYYALSDTATLSTSWQRFSYSTIIPSGATEFAIQFFYTPSGTASTNDYYDITGIQVEVGSSATTFSRANRTYQGELALCQRYYQVGGGIDNATPTFISYTSNGDTRGYFPLMTTMRTAPSVSFNNSIWRTITLAPGGADINPDYAVSPAHITDSQFGIVVTSGLGKYAAGAAVVWGTNTVNRGTQSLIWVAEAEL